MGVYIKGMEMPTSCGLGGVDGCGCPCFCAYNEQCQLLRRRIDTAFIKGAPIPNDCPLVPVPPHGRLIDADALIDAIIVKYIRHERNRELVFTVAEIKQDLADIINELPTIIPASEEGE